MKIEQALSLIKKPDSGSMKKAQNRFDTLAKPLKSLGLLEDSIIAIAGIQRSENIDISKKCIAVFCSDNGIVSRAVTQCGQEITAKVCEEISLDKTSMQYCSICRG